MGFLGISGARDGIEPIATGSVVTGFVWFAALSMPPKMPPKRKVPSLTVEFLGQCRAGPAKVMAQ